MKKLWWQISIVIVMAISCKPRSIHAGGEKSQTSDTSIPTTVKADTLSKTSKADTISTRSALHNQHASPNKEELDSIKKIKTKKKKAYTGNGENNH